jgi:hypothetical protein
MERVAPARVVVYHSHSAALIACDAGGFIYVRAAASAQNARKYNICAEKPAAAAAFWVLSLPRARRARLHLQE